MQKDKRETDFWTKNKLGRTKAAPGKYNVPILSGRKDHYYGPASFGSTQGRFKGKVIKEKKIPPGPGDYETEPLNLVSSNIKNSYQSVFNSKVDNSRQAISHSRSNSSVHKNLQRTAHTSQINNSILREGLNLNSKVAVRKGSENNISSIHDKFSHTYQYDTSSNNFGELGSLILNSPVDKPKKTMMKLRKGINANLKTNPSIPYKKIKKVEPLSPAKYNPNHTILHK